MNLERCIDQYIENVTGRSRAEYVSWAKEKYLADKDTVEKFWNLIEVAPCIRIIGDYDVDGILSTYILTRAIKEVRPNIKIKLKIPKRFTEGYGISDAIVDLIVENDEPGTLVITVDNGIAAKDRLELLERNGYTVAITDHHECKGELPDVSFLIDPHVGNGGFLAGYENLCGAGLVFKLVEQYISPSLRQELIVYAGVATIADCVPLIEGNWNIVKKALELMRRGKTPPQIDMLLSELGKSSRCCNEDTIGYYLGPAINAPGRLYDEGGRLALGYFMSATKEKAEELVSINEERKVLRDELFVLAEDLISNIPEDKRSPIWISSPLFHEGIVGIIAGNIVEKYHVPAIVLKELPDGTLKGSARSTDDVNILDYLVNCGADFIALGGHAGAAGMRMEKDEFYKAMNCQIQVRTEENCVEHIKETAIELSMDQIPEACEVLSLYAPFGEQNPAPYFKTVVDDTVDNVLMCGDGQEHMIIVDSDRTYKVCHFYHEPNNLVFKHKFGIYGNIGYQSFRGETLPTFSTEEAYDISSPYDLS